MPQDPSQTYLYLSISIVTFLNQSTFVPHWGLSALLCPAIPSRACLLGTLAFTVPSVPDAPPLLASSLPPQIFLYSPPSRARSADLKSSSVLLTSHHPLFHCSVASFMKLINFV